MAKRKRRSRISKTKLVPVETPTEQRKKFPKELLNAYLNLDKTKVLGSDYDFEYYEWTEEAYELYGAEAKKYLGDKAEDPIESGKLIVHLSRATMDMRDGKKEKTKKQTEED